MIAIYAYYHSRTGMAHAQRGEKKQDTAVFSENIHYQVFSLADGVSASKKGGLGAKIAVMKSCAFLLRLGGKAFRLAPWKTASLLLEEVLYHLKRRSAADCLPLSAYASTLTVCLADKKEPPTVLLCQLGNSAVLLCSAYSCIRLPGGQEPNAQTTSRGAETAMGVNQVNLQPDQHLCLCSDGFLDLLRDPCWGEDLRRAICRKEYGSMKRIVDAADPMDDATFLLLTQQPVGGCRDGGQ